MPKYYRYIKAIMVLYVDEIMDSNVKGDRSEIFLVKLQFI